VAEHEIGLLKEYYERNPGMERDRRFGREERKKLI